MVVYAHSSYNIPAPITNQKIIVDGNTGSKEWEWQDASKINFLSPRIRESPGSLFLQYEIDSNALSGAFNISDHTPILDDPVNPDQIAFYFDDGHTGFNTTSPNLHQIVLNRNGTAEYYKGKNASNVADNSSDYYDLKTISDGNTMDLEYPFLKMDFNVISIINKNSSWQGEFRIYLENEPRTYGFALQQMDSYFNTTIGTNDRYYTNFPFNLTTQTQIPYTWGDLSFFDIKKYNANIKKFCGKLTPSFTSDNIGIMCIRLNRDEMEVDVSKELTISGNFSNLFNGTGISDLIKWQIKDPEGVLQRGEDDILINATDGSFTFSTPPLDLQKIGKHEVSVNPNSFKELYSTADLTVREHVMTFDETISRINIVLGIVGAVIGFRQIYEFKKGRDENKQRNNAAIQMNSINQIYDRFEPDRHKLDKQQEALILLKQKRDQILQMYEKKEISAEHYAALDSKNSEYIKEFSAKEDEKKEKKLASS
jgi:hypothetical protein